MLLGRSMCNKVWKVRRKAKRTHYVERVSLRMWVHFRIAQNAKIWWFLKTTTRFICFARRCCSHTMLVLIVLDVDFMALRLHLCCLFLRFRARLFLPHSHHNFCHFDVVTMRHTSTTTALRTISLCKCTQHFEQDIAFLSETDVCAQATP